MNKPSGWRLRGKSAVSKAGALLLVLTLAAIAQIAFGADTSSLSIYGTFAPGTSTFAVEGYGDLLYYDDGAGVAHVVRVSVPAGADPNSTSPRTFTEIGTRNFKANIGWSGSDQAEFYVDKDYIYYGPKPSGSGGMEKWARNPDGTFGAYLGMLGIPTLTKGKTIGYDSQTGTWYAGNSSRAIYSFKVGVDTDWKLRFTYPAYGSGQGSHGGLEVVGGYLWVSDNNTDFIGQWQYSGTGSYNGWNEVARFNYSYTQDVKGLGFGPLGHFWASSGSQAAKGTAPSLYEIGGGPFRFSPAFSLSPASHSEGSTVSFSDTSVSWPDVITSLNWDFGGVTSADPKPAFTYGDNGTFTASLTATNSNGYQRTVTQGVSIANIPPSATIAADRTTVDEGSAITFTGTASDAGSDDLTFTWDWGDGTAAAVSTYRNNGTSADPLPSPLGTYPFSATDTVKHTYGDNGTYTVTLTVRDDDGGTTTKTVSVVVSNVAPTAGAGGPYSGNEASAITFAGTASDAGSDDLTFTWDWGDGTAAAVSTYRNNGTSADPLPSPLGTYPFSATDTVKHTYGDNGTYTVTLTVRDDDGGTTTRTVTVTVNNLVPTADAGGPYSGTEGNAISFTGAASDTGSDDLMFTWDWGDGTPATVTTYHNNGAGADPMPSPLGKYPFSATNTVKHTYGDNGTYTVTLLVQDDDGGVTTRTISVSVNNVAPAADAGANVVAREGESITVTGSFTDPGWLDTHSATIDWGDGTLTPAIVTQGGAGSTITAGHTYANKGVFSVTLTVNDDDGGAGQDTMAVYIPVGISVSVTPNVLPVPLNGRSIPLQDIPLQDIPLQDIPLQDIPLQDIDILSSPLQDIPLQDISIDWTAKLAGTLLEGANLATTTLKDVALAGIPLQDIPLQDIPLQDIPLQDIPLQDIPWESIPLQDIPLQDIFAPGDTVTYTLTVGNYGSVDAENVVITHTLPVRFRYLPGSSSGATTADPTVRGHGLTWGPFTIPANRALTLNFNAAAPTSLGTYYSDVSATGSITIPPASHTAPVTVSDTFEQNGAWEQAQGISADIWYLSYIGTSTDRDWYKIPVPVTKGSVVTVYLSHLPADYDLVLLGHVERSPNDIPLQDIPLQDIPLQDIPLQDIPLQDIPLQDIPLQDIPLQDIPLQDIPLQDIAMGRGTVDEIVRSRVVSQTGYFYVQVFGYNGAHSNEPYFLRVKVTSPLPVPTLTRSLPAAGATGTLFDPFGADARTIIVTNQQRLEQYYGRDAIYGANGLRGELEAFASLENVKGLILPVDYLTNVRSAYAAWDADAGSPEAANAVAVAIRLAVTNAAKTHPKVQYIVIAGSDEILPFRRVPDDVYLSNESAYAAKAHLKPSALFYSMLQGYVLTDDFYGGAVAVLWKGKELYLPKYAVGRLVETPGEMAAVLNEFEASGGALTVQTALVTGYDFLTDGAEAINGALKAKGLDPAVLINQGWTASDLARLLLGDPAPGLSSVNAHANHWAFGPASGGPFFSNQLLTSFFGGELVFSMGCHAGLNVDDSVSLPGNWSLDFPQAFARKATWFVGNTGYGYGDSDIVALSEELMNRFAQALGTAESPSVGQSLVNAKRGYFLNMGGYGPFDAKVLLQATLYGLPMYQVTVGSSGTAVPQPGVSLSITVNRMVDFNPAGSVNGGAQLVSKTLANGQYYSADGETQFTPYRPVQPQTSISVDYPGQAAHGAAFTGGTYEDVPGFDPLIARPANDDYTLPEPQFINNAWHPSKLHTLVSLQAGAGQEQRLVIVPGQFVTTSSAPHTIGIERLYTSLRYDVFYSTSSDYAAPVIGRADVTVTGGPGNYTARISVKASDPDSPAVPDDGLVKRVAVAWTYTIGDTSWKSANLRYDAASSSWLGDLTGLTASDIDVLVQAVDAAGNVGMSANKGWFYTPIPVNAGPDKNANEGTTTVFQGSIGQPIASPETLWDFGDGGTAAGGLGANHSYGDNGEYTAVFKVTDDKGGSGWDTLKVTVLNVPPLVTVANAVSVPYTDPLTLAGSFTDPGVWDTHTYRWDLTDPAGQPMFTVWGNLNLTVNWLAWLPQYPLPGTYAATLTVIDDDGGVGRGTTQVTITKTGTSTKVTSSANPSIMGQPVTFTATVAMVPPGKTATASPTGTVTFSRGTTVLGAGTLTTVGGVTTATFITDALPVGANEINATYGGDSVFEGSTGAVAQKVIYKFAGFWEPTPNAEFNGGSTIPVKFTLTDFNGAYVSVAVAEVSVNGGPTLGIARYSLSGNQYVFNLQTRELPLGDLVITVSLDDGTTHTVKVKLV